ncbi:MAG: hypothetical protein H6Q69_468 [Firmicutes bacterium]|nr:hypothetical protein [Bacillota bacterium]
MGHGDRSLVPFKTNKFLIVFLSLMCRLKEKLRHVKLRMKESGKSILKYTDEFKSHALNNKFILVFLDLQQIWAACLQNNL